MQTLRETLYGKRREKRRHLSWSEVDSREAALIRRCTAGDQTACAELVAEHQRMASRWL